MHLLRLCAIVFISVPLYKCNTTDRDRSAEEMAHILTTDLSNQFALKTDTIISLNFKETYLFSYQQYCYIPLNLKSNIVTASSGLLKENIDTNEINPKYLTIEVYLIRSEDQAKNIFNMIIGKIKEKNRKDKHSDYCINDANAIIDTIFTKSNRIVVAKYGRFEKSKTDQLLHFLQADFNKL